jgi:hypothetical protein
LHAINFCKTLFGPAPNIGVRLDSSIWSENERLTDDDRATMDERFTKEEIKKCIDHMQKNKVAGLDGIPVEFY